MLGLQKFAIYMMTRFSYALASSNENESGSKARIKRVNLEDLPKKLTAEERKMLECRKKLGSVLWKHTS